MEKSIDHVRALWCHVRIWVNILLLWFVSRSCLFWCNNNLQTSFPSDLFKMKWTSRSYNVRGPTCAERAQIWCVWVSYLGICLLFLYLFWFQYTQEVFNCSNSHMRMLSFLWVQAFLLFCTVMCCALASTVENKIPTLAWISQVEKSTPLTWTRNSFRQAWTVRPRDCKTAVLPQRHSTAQKI